MVAQEPVSRDSTKTGSIRPIAVALAVAATVAILSALYAYNGQVSPTAVKLIDAISPLVPSLAMISAQTRNPKASQLVLGLQWALLPLHVFVWMYAAAPWSQRVRNSVKAKARRLTRFQKVLFVLGCVFLAAWALGNVGLVDFPTLYNGKYVYPPADSIPQLRLIYTSDIALTIYAWMSPVVETTCLWMLLLFSINFKVYLTTPPSPESTK